MQAMRTQSITQDAVETIERPYEIREPEEVWPYLEKNPDLFDLLVEAAAKISEFIPPDGRLILDLVWEREEAVEGEGDELFAIIPTRLGWQEVRPDRDRLIREWLIPAARHAVGRFNVNVEYR